MIKVFNRIRQKLLGNGQFVGYTKYAIGEIILVMVGILLAIQVNGWNENRKDRIEEQQILESLKEELTFNFAQIQQGREIHRAVSDACGELLNHVGPMPILDRSADFDTLFNLSVMSYLLSYKDGALQSLISSGKMGLISNHELRQHLAQLPGSVSEVTNLELTFRQITWDKYGPFLEQHLAYVQVFRAVEEMAPLFPAKSRFSSDHEEILRERQLENLLAFRVVLTALTLQEYDSLEAKSTEILGLIDQELDP